MNLSLRRIQSLCVNTDNLRRNSWLAAAPLCLVMFTLGCGVGNPPAPVAESGRRPVVLVHTAKSNELEAEEELTRSNNDAEIYSLQQTIFYMTGREINSELAAGILATLADDEVEADVFVQELAQTTQSKEWWVSLMLHVMRGEAPAAEELALWLQNYEEALDSDPLQLLAVLFDAHTYYDVAADAGISNEQFIQDIAFAVGLIFLPQGSDPSHLMNLLTAYEKQDLVERAANRDAMISTYVVKALWPHMMGAVDDMLKVGQMGFSLVNKGVFVMSPFRSFRSPQWVASGPGGGVGRASSVGVYNALAPAFSAVPGIRPTINNQSAKMIASQRWPNRSVQSQPMFPSPEQESRFCVSAYADFYAPPMSMEGTCHPTEEDALEAAMYRQMRYMQGYVQGKIDGASGVYLGEPAGSDLAYAYGYNMGMQEGLYQAYYELPNDY